MHPVRRIVILSACLCAAGAVMPVAEAIPSNTKINRVFKLPCTDDVCDSAHDDVVANSAAVAGSLQVHVSSSSSVGLVWVRLDARKDAGEWHCIKQWDLDTGSFSGVFNWNTNRWPGDCPSGVEGDTRNGVYDLRLVAREKVTDDQQTSQVFSVYVGNKPSVPSWAGDLSVSGASERRPLVAFRFNANPEPDLYEYHYMRVSPDGDENEWAISAAKPGGQGCDQEGSTYICFDDVFPASGFGGTYTYGLIAYRTTPNGTDTCALAPQPRCVQSSLSDARSITINEPAPPKTKSSGSTGRPTTGSTQPSGSGNTGSTVRGSNSSGGGAATYCDFYCGKYNKFLDYGDRPYEVAPGSSASSNSTLTAASLPGDGAVDRSSMWRSIAGGMLLLLAAAHAARVLRRA